MERLCLSVKIKSSVFTHSKGFLPRRQGWVSLPLGRCVYWHGGERVTEMWSDGGRTRVRMFSQPWRKECPMKEPSALPLHQPADPPSYSNSMSSGKAFISQDSQKERSRADLCSLLVVLGVLTSEVLRDFCWRVSERLHGNLFLGLHKFLVV